jgi:hypothetical protein
MLAQLSILITPVAGSMIGGSFHIGFSEIASFNDAIRQLYFF